MTLDNLFGVWWSYSLHIWHTTELGRLFFRSHKKQLPLATKTCVLGHVGYSPRGGNRSIHDGGGSNGASYCEPQKMHEPVISHPKNTWHQNFLPQKVQDLTSRY